MRERKISEEKLAEEAGIDRDLQSPPMDQLDNVLDLRTVLKTILKWSWILIIFVIAGLAYGVNEAINFTPLFRAKMVIAPQSTALPGSSSSPTSGAGGLSTKLALVLSGHQSTGPGGAFGRLQMIMKSQQLARRLAEKHGLDREIFASSWDEEKGTWKVPKKVEPSWRKKLDILLQQDQSLAPGTELLARAIGGILVFTRIEETSFWKVEVNSADSDIALRWLQIIYAEADDLLRDRDRKKLLKQIEFLRSRLDAAELSDLRQGLFAALLSQEKSLHMIESNLPYAAEIVEPAYASALKTRPNLTKLIGTPVSGAVFVGLLLVVLIGLFLRE